MYQALIKPQAEGKVKFTLGQEIRMSDKFQFLLYTFTPYKNCRTLSNPRFFDQYPTLSVGQSTVPLSKALEDFEQINYNALLCGGEELCHLQPLVPVTSDLWAV